jgi:hypothetical protein
MTKWETVYRRSEDPKLAYLESRLDDLGIPHRRNGHSWHAPILQVPEQHADAAWKLLNERIGRRRLDEIDDDDPRFARWVSA